MEKEGSLLVTKERVIGAKEESSSLSKEHKPFRTVYRSTMATRDQTDTEQSTLHS
jgi:hypothetical protein